MKAVLKKKSVLIVALAVLLIGTGVAVTLAYLSSRTPTLTNTFKVGNVTTKIEEPFEQETNTTFKKEPSVKNIGENECYVRARVLASPEEALLLKGFSNNWTYDKYDKDDDFYYYNAVLPAGGQTDAIFKKVEVKDTSIDGFEVTVYQEAVQTKVYAQDGTFTTDPEKIWDCYESGKVPASFKTNS